MKANLEERRIYRKLPDKLEATGTQRQYRATQPAAWLAGRHSQKPGSLLGGGFTAMATLSRLLGIKPRDEVVNWPWRPEDLPWKHGGR